MVTSANMEVLNIGISNMTLSKQYDAPLARIVNGVATTGRTGGIVPPASNANMSYEIRSFIPLLRCTAANNSVRVPLWGVLKNAKGLESPIRSLVFPEPRNISERLQDNFTWTYPLSNGRHTFGGIGYFAAMRSDSIGHSIWNSTVITRASIGRLSGEIMIAIANYFDDHSMIRKNMEYISCGLHNTSVLLEVVFTNHAAAINVKNITYGDPVSPTRKRVVVNGVQTDGPFCELFRLVASHLLKPSAWGAIADTAYTETPQSNIMMTSLALLRQVSIMDKAMKNRETQIQDSNHSDDLRNISLSHGIEEFSLNTSLSILSNPDLWYVVFSNP